MYNISVPFWWNYISWKRFCLLKSRLTTFCPMLWDLMFYDFLSQKNVSCIPCNLVFIHFLHHLPHSMHGTLCFITFLNVCNILHMLYHLMFVKFFSMSKIVFNILHMHCLLVFHKLTFKIHFIFSSFDGMILWSLFTAICSRFSTWCFITIFSPHALPLGVL